MWSHAAAMKPVFSPCRKAAGTAAGWQQRKWFTCFLISSVTENAQRTWLTCSFSSRRSSLTPLLVISHSSASAEVNYEERCGPFVQ